MSEVIRVGVPNLPLPQKTAAVLCEAISGAEELLQRAAAMESSGERVCWQSDGEGENRVEEGVFDWPYFDWPYFDWPYFDWPRQPTILALVPHWRCERWLYRCLASLVQQTHPLTHIVVIDDGSVRLPLEIVKRFASVTLLSAAGRVGPYRLVQSVIERTDYTAYLFQDADDWSSCDRLETLLKTARTYRAELVGSQEIRVLESSFSLQSVGYPIDVNRALCAAPGHGLLHPTSLVTRHLVQRLGGFATGLKFGGDSEFLLRAQWAARIVNSPRYCYFRRKRPDSLTTSKQTGLESVARQQLTQEIKRRAIARSNAIAAQQPLDLSPLVTAPPIELTYVCGPQLQWI